MTDLSPQSDNASHSPRRLVIFSDDWGRHPSSCQHLVGHLLDRYPTLWVNTIGTRRPKLSTEDLSKLKVKIGQWLNKPMRLDDQTDHLTIVNPLMYPGFRTGWQRGLNARLIARNVNRTLGKRLPGEIRVGVTTVPVTADVVDRIDVDRWVYYCVDDFSVWPGLDGSAIDGMERRLVKNVQRVVTVSETLQRRVASMGRESVLLSHGIDLEHWDGHTHTIDQVDRQGIVPTGDTIDSLPEWWPNLPSPIFLFWGVVDQRLDTACCIALSKLGGTLMLVGPQQSPDPKLGAQPHIRMPGPVPFSHLPTLAKAADVLVMPYADLPVTRAIQPLKLKEYLATGKPTVVRKLPSTIPWSDAADVVETSQQFSETAKLRAQHGTPVDQQQARRRLDDETWDRKAVLFEQVLFGQG